MSDETRPVLVATQDRVVAYDPMIVTVESVSDLHSIPGRHCGYQVRIVDRLGRVHRLDIYTRGGMPLLMTAQGVDP
jgi:hypothetical protein